MKKSKRKDSECQPASHDYLVQNTYDGYNSLSRGLILVCRKCGKTKGINLDK